ncbi:PAS domain S-box-containing protein [Sphingomonas naasensis]|uniref:histidine kinase n=1 Tax=Sphingomonas naasensis TaxID=1344951 RepID=A0A4S1WW63_9SPHN|nr:PAS domain S-box protein [Sphingomonas naasensis]NIJ19341.1 PAS domain S-box-containing protein [Sphingomonas naasensis]TGX46510.1 PAS domain S-box protein [Sphingomonas naasensis]
MIEAEPAHEPLPVGEDEFRMIADSAPVAVWVTRLDRTRSFVNRAYVEFVGVPYDEALAFDWRRIIHPEDAAHLLAQSVAGEASLGTFDLEGRYRNAKGEWRWLRSTSSPRRDMQGRHIGFIGVAHDVTEAKEAELALRDREAQLSAFISQSTAGFAQVDLEGRFTLLNDRFCEIAGWSRDELMGMRMLDITHPEDRDRNRPLFERAVAVGTPYTHEKRYVRKDGSIVWVNNSVSVIRRPDGEPFGVLAVTLDVTGRREAEGRLRKSEESLRLATESAGMASWELDLETMEGEWSPNRFDLLGLDRRADSRGSFDEWIARIHADDRERVRAAAQRCFRTGQPYTIEYRVCRADNREERWLQSHGSRIDYDDRRPSRFVGVSFDITDRKRAEEELRASEGRFRTIFEQANDFLLTTSLDQVITSVNPAVVAALDYPVEKIVGAKIGDFMDPDQLALAMAAFEQKMREGGSTRLTVTVRARDGRPLIWEINSRLTTDAEGKPTGLHAIGRDMTEAKRAEAHLRLLVDELNHRVKNTLAIVQGVAQQSFKGAVDPATARRAFEGRLAALSEAHNLLTREHWGAVSMAQIIGDAVAPHGDAGRFTFEGPDLPILPKTAISLALAMHELATNAVKHGALSRPEGRVAIRWERIERDGGTRLALVWQERGGPAVTAPTRRGFGTRMIERGLAAELAGTVAIDFRPDGLVCTVDAPLPEGAE